MKKLKRSSPTKKIIITTLSLCGAALLVAPALSYWSIVEEQQYRHDETIGFNEEDEEFYDVEFYRTVVEAGEIDSGTSTDYTISDEDSYNQFLGFIDDYSIYIDYDDTDYYYVNKTTLSGTYYYYYVNTLYSSEILVDGSGNEQYRAILEITTEVAYHDALISRNNSWSGAYTLTVYTMSDASQVTETTSYGSMQVRSGEIITSRMFSTFLENMKEDYYFSSLIYTDSEFTEYFYLNETTVTSDLTLYVLFYQNSPSSMGISTLTSAMESNSGTLQASNAEDYSHFQIQDDPSYNSSTNTIYLGYGNKTAVAPSGSTLNLCLTDENVYTEMTYSSNTSDTNWVVDESNKTCDYTVKLCGDIVLDGALTIGGEIGSRYNAGVQSNINTHYVCLDLCGHTITVNNGGALLSYGVVIDSVGNGLIDVKGGGSFQTLFVVYDYYAGGSTLGAFAFDVSPFFNYTFPYIQVPVMLEYDFTYGWGSFDAYFYFHPFGSLVTELDTTCKLVGGQSETLLHLDSGTTDSYVLINMVKNSKVIDESETDYSQATSSALERHINFYFYNCDVTVDYFVIAFSTGIGSVDMKSNQFDFPISPFFSLYFYSSNMKVNSRLCFMKGSSLYLDKDSSLTLGYQTISRTRMTMLSTSSENVDISGRILFMDVAANTYEADGYLISSDRHTTNSSSTQDNLILTVNSFYKYAYSSFKIDGTLLFLEGNSESTPYSIAGRCDVKQVGVIDSDGTEKHVTPLSSTDTSEYNPFTIIDYYETQDTSDGSSVYYQTYDFDGVNGRYYYGGTMSWTASSCAKYMNLLRGRSLPLISNGKAYSLSNIHNDSTDTSDSLYSPNIVGTYDDTLNLIESGSNYYFYYTGNADDSTTVYPYLTDNSSRGYVYNHDTQLIECSYDNTNHLVSATIDSTSYSFAYFSSCYLPYSSSGGTVYIQRLVGGTTNTGGTITLNVSVSWSSSYNSWVR